MIFRALLLSMLISLLWGCATPTASVGASYSLDSNSANGLLVGSVKYSGLLSGYKVYFHGLDNDASGYFEAGKGIMLNPIPPKSDFRGVNGVLQVTELPAGNYEISRWGVTSGYAHISQTQPFSIKFKIEPGKATYIGSFVFSVTKKMGLTVTGVNVDFKESYSEDVGILRQKYLGLEHAEIYMGLESNLLKKDIGGESSTHWTMPPTFLFIPVGG